MVALETPGVELGRPIPDFDLPGTDGARHRMEDCRGQRGTVVMFICNHCPFVRAALDRIVRDAGELAGTGIATVAIMSNDTTAYPDDSFENMQRLSAEYELPFPYLYDESQETARAFGAVCTPDFFGYNAAGQLQYRGRLDAGRTDPPPEGSPRELYEAMKTIAETGACPSGQQASIGCSIKWRPSD